MDTVLKKRMLLLLYETPAGISHAELLNKLDASDRAVRETLDVLLMTPLIIYRFDEACGAVYRLSGLGRVYIERRGIR